MKFSIKQIYLTLILSIIFLFVVNNVEAASLKNTNVSVSNTWQPKDIMTVVIAFIALILSLINTGILIYKEFFKKEPTPRLDVTCDHAWMRSLDSHRTHVAVQINASIRAVNGLNTIKQVKMIHNGPHPVFGSFGSEKNDQLFQRSYNYWNVNVLKKFNTEELDTRLNNDNKDHNYTELFNLSITENQSISISLIDRFSGFRFPDGYEDIPMAGWTLEITDGTNQKYSCEFDFIDYKK